jgi:hypothetical protein
MSQSICGVALLGLAFALAAGCEKKPQSAERTDSRRPAARDAGTEPGTVTPEKTPAVRSANPNDEGLPGIPPELLASDRAYEAWFKKYDLDLSDPKMLDADPDGDGASNRDEFVADTNPRDPNSRPGIHKTMRLEQYTEVRVPLLLESVEGDRARIKHLDGAQGTEMVTPGQMINGMKVERVVSRHETDKEGLPVDLSRVTLEDGTTKEKVVLVKDMPAKTAASFAILVSADRQHTLKVHEGEVFNWPEEQGISYKVIDLRADQVVVQQVNNKQMWTIPKM